VQIRRVTEDDRDEWARMRAALYPPHSPDEIDQWFEHTDDGGTPLVGVAVFVADRGDGRLAGFVEVGARSYAEGCETSPVAFLEGLYVDPDCRERGLGRCLVAAAEVWAAAQGFTEIGSDTEIDNELSLKVHLRLGYREVERQICFVKRLGEPSTDD
jgi:aminoglycoside 6'-N-acetyltransferase I